MFTFSSFRHIGIDVKFEGVERDCFGTSRMPGRIGDKRPQGKNRWDKSTISYETYTT
jgi:hypothetical protein